MSYLSSTNKAGQTPQQHKVSLFRVKPCKGCGSEWHSKWNCPFIPRKGLAKVGRQGRRTAKAVTKWKRKQQANHQGYFVCYMCGKWITYLEAEHVKSKARRPDQRTNQKNFKPVCEDCNAKKGSKNG